MTNASTLILAAGSLGDCLLTLPALQKLQSLAPVTIAGTNPYQQLGSALIGVDSVIPLDSTFQPLLTAGLSDPQFFKKFTDIYFFFKDSEPNAVEKLKLYDHLKIH